ncbi:MAG TPA: hypothetical protein VGI11_02465 [Variovorax sp.]
MKKFAVSLAVGAASLLSLGAVVAPSAAQAQPAIDIRVGPPPPRFEPVPPPRHGYVWAGGHYEWVGGRYAWRPGGWVHERPGYVYRTPQWEQHEGRWAYHGGGWDRS